MMLPKYRTYRFSLHRTILKGFNAEIMRWNPGKEFGGILVRGFGFRFMWYGTRP
jgi:hypothetical protein